MAVFNLRGIPDDLARQVKATAASEGKTLIQFVMDIVESEMKSKGWTPAPAGEKKRIKSKRAPINIAEDAR